MQRASRAAACLCCLPACTSCWPQMIAMQDEKAQLLKRLAVVDASIKRGQPAKSSCTVVGVCRQQLMLYSAADAV